MSDLVGDHMKSKLLVAVLLLSCSQPNKPKDNAPITPTNATSSAAIVADPPKTGEAKKELVAWRKDMTFAQALEEAKKTNKPIMIDIYATWCGPCHEMDKSVYTRQDVADATANLIALKMDGEHGEGKEIHDRYNVVGFPTILFLHPDGAEIDRVFGGVNGEDFIKAVNDFSQNKNTIAELESKLVAAGDAAELSLIYEVGFRHCLRGDEAKATEILGRAIKADADNSKGYASQAMFAIGNYLYLRGQGKADKAIETLTELQKKYPESKEAKSAPTALAKAYLIDKKPEKTRELLDLFIADPKADSSAYNKYAWFCFQQKYDLPRGVEVAKKGLEKNPKDDALWDTLAELLFATGDAAGAVSAIEEAIKISPEDAYYKEQKTKFAGVR
jgi:thioredoxin-like negative regulator of GroEL